MKLASPLTGVVVDVVAAEGARVPVDGAVLVIESMKMHHEVGAPAAGMVRDLAVAVGDQVSEGQVLFRIDAADVDGAGPDAPDAADPDAIRADLAEALDRRHTTTDEARPRAMERRHATGLRSARENVADLVDPGTFSEYGGLAIAAQRARRELDDLIENTPADGIVTGIGAVNSELFGADARAVILAYDYTVLAGTQGIRTARPTG